MPALTCRRCRTPLAPVFPGQTEHPLCSPTDTGWIPAPAWTQDELTAAEPIPPGLARHDPPGLALALELAAVGWHMFPLSAASKRPLANCPACTSHDPDGCPCLTAGRWCHGVRAATTDPRRLTSWWRAEPAAVPGVAAGPSGLVLIDLDAHGTPLPPDLATGLLPGIDLTAEPIPPSRWRNPARFRDGRDTLLLLAELRGGPHPWPPEPASQPVTVATPTDGRHLWYRAPKPGLHQANSDPKGRHGLGWQIDIKAGWSHGLAPGAIARTGRYRQLSSHPSAPGIMPAWLAREITRVCQPTPHPAQPQPPNGRPGREGAAYLTRVIDRGARQLAQITDGRKHALAALAYQVGGLLAWSGLGDADITDQLINAGTAAGLSPSDARSRVVRSLANGRAKPIVPQPVAGRTGPVA
jgi:Bifunctional DNA primase/polymerase, N-terminal